MKPSGARRAQRGADNSTCELTKNSSGKSTNYDPLGIDRLVRRMDLAAFLSALTASLTEDVAAPQHLAYGLACTGPPD